MLHESPAGATVDPIAAGVDAPAVTLPATDPKPHQRRSAFPPAARLRDRFPRGVNWWNVAWLAAMHVGAVAAFWHFHWSGLLLFAVMYFISACLGVTLCYHRMVTHRGLAMARPMQYLFNIFAMLSGQGSPLFWVSTHRKHHAMSDREGDPHSPYDGYWWSHMLWLKPKEDPVELVALFKRWAPDLYRDPVHRFFDRVFPAFTLLVAPAMFLAGYLTGLLAGGPTPLELGWTFLLWGLCLRIVCVYHITWSVNSATHIWGYRNYETGDRSRNLWWVGLLAFGEGWHNNHHAYQRLARHGHRWWELDLTYVVILILKKLRIARDVLDEIPLQQTSASEPDRSPAPEAASRVA